MKLPNSSVMLKFILLFLATSLSSILYFKTREPKISDIKDSLSLAYYLDTAEISGMGANGEILYQLTMDRASHVIADDSITMREVEMLYTPKELKGWKMSADEGRIPSDGSIIELFGNVVVQSGEKNQIPTKITTEKMAINPSKNQARTNQDVIVDYDGRLVKAKGIEVDLNQNRLKLLSQVKGSFSPVN
ncbi:MAG: LPS export ABC transporter periplasmic protein LptC [Pseudomonadota bacterium]|nr:LPS export ABC transporter periplasmic protein LptC [Pseudomonadota bacterium]